MNVRYITLFDINASLTDISPRFLATLLRNDARRRDLGLIIYIKKINARNKHVMKKLEDGCTGSGPGTKMKKMS